MKFLNISELCENIKKNIPNEKYYVCGEISSLKFNDGHCYFIIKEKSFMMKCIIWKSVIGNVKINDGDNIKLYGHLNFYHPNGSINFVVVKIIEIDGLGQQYLEFDKLKEEYLKKGFFDRKRKIKKLITNIYLLTSVDGAAIQDFMYVINKSKQKININLINVNVQGVNCVREICDNLNKINDDYDLIIITRGGGSYEDLCQFNNKLILDSVFNQKNIVLSAIGHQTDITLTDYVSDISTPTPSLAGEFIVNHNLQLINNIESVLENNKLKIINKINDYEKRIIQYENKLESPIKQMEDKLNEIKLTIQRRIDNYELELEKLKNKLEMDKNVKLINDGKFINSLEELNSCKNNKFKLLFIDGEVEIEIKK